MFFYTIALAASRNFAPDNLLLLHVYFSLFGIMVVPKFLFSLCSFLGWAHCRYHHTHNNWGNLVGLLLGFGAVIAVAYGGTWGFRKVEVRHEEYRSADLPKAFDGYRIVQFSDAHVGTYGSSYVDMPEKVVDLINKQKADMVVFTGDLQNMEPKELYPFMPVFERIKAKDGVFSVLGNHDYAEYVKAESAVKVANEREPCQPGEAVGMGSFAQRAPCCKARSRLDSCRRHGERRRQALPEEGRHWQNAGRGAARGVHIDVAARPFVLAAHYSSQELSTALR